MTFPNRNLWSKVLHKAKQLSRCKHIACIMQEDATDRLCLSSETSSMLILWSRTSAYRNVCANLSQIGLCSKWVASVLETRQLARGWSEQLKWPVKS